MKKDTYYFSHDSGAQEDPKCVMLIEQLGMEGYGIFWALVERLRNEKDFKLPLALLPALSRRWNTSKEKVEAVVKMFGLFSIEKDLFFSLRLMRSMKEFNEKRKFLSDSGKKGNEIRWHNPPIASLSGGDSPPIALKESKAKQSKAKEINESKAKEINQTTGMCFEILEYFGFTELNHPSKLFKINAFLNSFDIGKLEHFKNQFKYYQLYKLDAKEKKHGFDSFLDGGWDAENWEKKHNDFKKNNSTGNIESLIKNYKPITFSK